MKARLEPRNPNSGYAIEAQRQDRRVTLTFLRSVGYDTSTKNTPAFDVEVSHTGLAIILQGLKDHPEEFFSLSAAICPAYAKGSIRIEHHPSYTPRMDNLVYLNRELGDGSRTTPTVATADACIAFLEELLQ